MARLHHPKAKRSPMASSSSFSAPGGSSSAAAAAFFADGPPPPNLEPQRNKRRPATPAGSPSVSSHVPEDILLSSDANTTRSRRCILCAASGIIVFSVICALYRLAVTLPTEYVAVFSNDSGAASTAAGGRYYERRKEEREGSSPTHQSSKSATAAVAGIGESIQSAANSAWSSIVSLGGGSSSGSGTNAMDERSQESKTLYKFYKERAKERRLRTTPRVKEQGGGDEDDDARQVEATLVQTRWPHNHAASSASRTGLLPKRDQAVRMRYDRLKKQQQQQQTAEANLSSNSTQISPPPPPLCGLHAQSASTKHPTSYTSAPLDAQSRILITGIVSNAVGYHLALYLATNCRVSTIIGIDALYPNTLDHRLQLSQRMARLQNALRDAGTELVRPVMLSYVGVDQMVSGGSRGTWPILNTTGELDYVRKYRPTHMVHLAGMDVDAYRDVLGGRRGMLNGGGSPFRTSRRMGWGG